MKNIFILIPGRRILELREKKGLKQLKFAELIGRSRQTVSGWEKTTTVRIEEDEVVKMAKVLGVDVKVFTEPDQVTSVSAQGKDDYVPAHVLEHYRNTTEHIMNENKELWSWVKELRTKGSNAK